MMCQRFRSRSVSVSVFTDSLNDAVGFALVHLEGTDLVDELIDHVTEIESIQHAHAEVDGELQSGFAARGLDAVRLLEEQHAEAFEAGVLQREPILRLIHAKAARSAGARSEEDVVVDDLLSGHVPAVPASADSAPGCRR